MTDFTMTTDADGVATITWDVPSKSMNVMSTEAFLVLSGLIDQALADGTVKGVIITSGKKDFAGGMDLNAMAEMKAKGGEKPAQAIFDAVMATHRLLRKIERAGMDPKTLKGSKPVAAALPGTGVGIGFELPLACHRILPYPVCKASSCKCWHKFMGPKKFWKLAHWLAIAPSGWPGPCRKMAA